MPLPLKESIPQQPELDRTSALVFRHVVSSGRFQADAIARDLNLSPQSIHRAKRTLLTYRLLQPSAHDPGLLLPVNPEVAAAELTAPAENRIRELQRGVDESRSALTTLMHTYMDGRQDRDRFKEPLHAIGDDETAQAMISEHVDQCDELLVAQPHAALVPEAHRTTLRDTLVDALLRGAQVQGVFQHATLVDADTRGFVEDIRRVGADIRITGEVICGQFVFDRASAIVLPSAHGEPLGARQPTAHAIAVTEPITMEVLCTTFELLWNQATHFSADESVVSDDLKLSILRLLADGRKDDVIARRLGISVRTCRRHIKEVMVSMRADSRFQFGVRAALSGSLEKAIKDLSDEPV